MFNLAPSDPFKLVPIEKPISMSASKHIGYAIQWFGLSVVLVVMTLIAFLKRMNKGIGLALVILITPLVVITASTLTFYLGYKPTSTQIMEN